MINDLNRGNLIRRKVEIYFHPIIKKVKHLPINELPYHILLDYWKKKKLVPIHLIRRMIKIG